MSHSEHHHHEHEHEHYDVHECDGAGHEHHHHADGTCCCEQHAKEFHGIEKPVLIRLIAAAVLYLCGMLLPVGEVIEAILMIASALLSGYDVILSAVKNVIKLRFFDEYFLMSFAAIAACAIGEFEEGAAVFLLYRIGEFCQSYAIRHSRRTIASLGGEHHCEDTSKPTDQFITRFARVYTPVILCFAVALVIFIPVFSDESIREAIYRALTFLVLACPCAIVISVPLSYFAGIAAGSRSGIFFRDSAAVDTVAQEKNGFSALQSVTLDDTTAYLYSTDGGTDLHRAELVMTGEDKSTLALRIARKSRFIARENVIFTIVIKLAVLILSAFGISALWFAVFADSGVTVIVVLNALRAFYVKK